MIGGLFGCFMAGMNVYVARAAMFMSGGATFGLVQRVLAPFRPRRMKWFNPKLMVASGFFIMALALRQSKN